MRKLIAIILASAIIGVSGHFNEMLKIPFLITHYNEHKIAHPEDSVLTFLYKHYILNQEPESEKDSKSDSRLPFKSSQTFHSGFSVFICSKIVKDQHRDNSVILFRSFTPMHTLSAFFDIWQPPKVG